MQHEKAGEGVQVYDRGPAAQVPFWQVPSGIQSRSPPGAQVRHSKVHAWPSASGSATTWQPLLPIRESKMQAISWHCPAKLTHSATVLQGRWQAGLGSKLAGLHWVKSLGPLDTQIALSTHGSPVGFAQAAPSSR